MFEICPKAYIDLVAIQQNYKNAVESIAKHVVPSAVIKNDAYGLGAQKVAQALYEVGCRNFWVAYLKEAIDIRRVLPLDANIFFLQGFHKDDFELLKTYKIIPVINSLQDFENIKGKNMEFVIHVDTGLTRLGFREADIDAVLSVIAKEKIKYVISHLACSDDIEHKQNESQKEAFDKIIEKIKKVNDRVHFGISASAGMLLGNDFCYDIVRIGAFLYGIEVMPGILPLNVFSLKTSVLQKYDIDPGVCVGYGATFTSLKKMTVAVVSIGYADGIKRALSNKGSVLFYDEDRKNFYKAKIIGKISMDLLVCDVSEIPSNITDISKEVVILDKNYSINDMANDADTVPYEILTSINFKSKRFEIHYNS